MRVIREDPSPCLDTTHRTALHAAQYLNPILPLIVPSAAIASLLSSLHYLDPFCCFLLPMRSPCKGGKSTAPPNSMTTPLSFLCSHHSGRTRILNRFPHNTVDAQNCHASRVTRHASRVSSFEVRVARTCARTHTHDAFTHDHWGRTGTCCTPSST